ncbi:MAG: hypothetical protein IPN34_07430 [Planctomycetes bacterium]|nr:hypothetical protein [Planctomycetota bacterium]
MSGPERHKHAAPERFFAHGPLLEEGCALRAWLLDSELLDPTAIVRLPVRVSRSPQGLGLGTAAVVAPSGARLLDLALDDTALGIALADHLRRAWTERPDVDAWLEGLVSDTDASTVSFAIRRFVGLVDDAVRSGDRNAWRAYPEDAAPELIAAVDDLALSFPVERRRAARYTLRAGGERSLPVLLAALGDERVHARRDAVNRQNAFVGNPPPAPQWIDVPVSTVIEDLLAAIAIPGPSRAFDHRGKVLSTQVLSIPSWPRFLARRRGRSLAEVHAELQPLVDRYWELGGVTQGVDG